MFVAEQFTGTPGQYVPINETVRGFREILEGGIELAASLNVRLLSASNELLSVLASFCQTPNALFAQDR
jgi:F0F1-type ATP synthase beta subunit